MVSILKNNIELSIYCFIVCLVIFIRDVYLISIPDSILIIPMVLPMIRLKFENLACFLFFLFPFTCGIPGYIMLFGIILLYVKGTKINVRQSAPVIVVLIIELFTEMVGADVDTIIGILSFISFTALFFYLLHSNDKRLATSKFIAFYSTGLLFTLIVIYYNMISLYGFEEILTGMLRSGAMGVADNDSTIMRGHIAMNANTIAYCCICAISSLIFTFRNNNANKIPLYFLISLLTIGGILSFSRTFLMVSALLGIIVLFQSSKGNFARNIFILLGLAVIMYFVFPGFFDSVFLAFQIRGEEENIATAGGRTVLFDYYNKKWSTSIFNVIFGVGTVTYRAVLNGPNAIHNGLQQLWVCLGVIGLLTYISSIYMYIKREYIPGKLNLLVPFLITLLFDQSIQSINPYPLILPLLVSLMVLKCNKSSTI